VVSKTPRCEGPVRRSRWVAGLNRSGIRDQLASSGRQGKDQENAATDWPDPRTPPSSAGWMSVGSVIVPSAAGWWATWRLLLAATWLRGIAVVQVPTTLLADGGRRDPVARPGDHPGGKTLIGPSTSPAWAHRFRSTLASLHGREFRGGDAESESSTAVMRRSRAVRRFGRRPRSLPAARRLGRSCCETLLGALGAAKARVVAADEREGGFSLGGPGRGRSQTTAHPGPRKVETLCGYGTFLHGESGGPGLLAAGDLAVAMGLCDRPRPGPPRAVTPRAGLAGLQLSRNSMPARAGQPCRAYKKVKDGQLALCAPPASARW